MTSIEDVIWDRDTWSEPPPLPTRWIETRSGGRAEICPYIGVALPPRGRGYNEIRDEDDFEFYLQHHWYSKREKSWDMPPFTRDAWFNLIMSDWETWDRRIRFDMTPRFKEQVKKLLQKGGFVMVIGGNPSEQGDGKSIGGLMVIDMLQNEFGISVRPNILWEHSHMQLVIQDIEEEWVILDIDEDLQATGEGSKNILIEISNTKQTQRKAKIIIISIGINPEHSHPAVNIHLIPCGINKRRQATRFAIFKRGRFMGWVVLQRRFRPDMPVLYGPSAESDTIDSYKHRAVEHSRRVIKKNVSAFPPEMEAQHQEIVREWLEMKRQQSGNPENWRPPPIDVIITKCKPLGLPTKTVGYPRRIAATALWDYQQEHPEAKKERTETVDISVVQQDMAEFWEDYQQVVFSKYPNDYEFADRDAWMLTLKTIGMTHAQIKDHLNIDIRVNSIGERIRKGVSEWHVEPSNTQLGTIGERLIGSRIESSGITPVAYVRSLEESARKDMPDVSDTGLVRNAGWAVNVKVSMEEDFDRTFETSPEHEVSRSWCVFLFPRLAKLAVCDIIGETTRYNSGDMVLCGIAEGVERLKELVKDGS